MLPLAHQRRRIGISVLRRPRHQRGDLGAVPARVAEFRLRPLELSTVQRRADCVSSNEVTEADIVSRTAARPSGSFDEEP